MSDPTDASSLILKDMTDYSRHLIDNQFPSPIDGLKKVHRRIIWANRKAKGKLSGADLVADTSKKHPYGDQSIYDSAVRMSQPFKMTYPLLNLIGDCGTYSGDSRAAMRYVSFELSEFTTDIFLDNVAEKTFRMIQDENLEDTEPSYFIPKLPTALLLGSKTVGIGTNSIIIPYRLDKVCSGVMEYSLFRKKNPNNMVWSNKTAGKYFVPYFPIDDYVRNVPHLIHHQTNGKYNHHVIIDGVLEITNNTILIKTLPINIELDQSIQKILAAMRTKGSWLDKHLVSFDILSSTKMDADLLLTFRRSVDIFDALVMVKKLITFTGYITPSGNYTLDRYLIALTPPQVLEVWYRERYNSILGKKKYTQMRLTKEINKVDVALLVSGRVKEVIEIIRTHDLDAGKAKLQKVFNITLAQAILLYSMPLSTMAKTSKPELEAIRARLTAENEEIRNSYGKINEEIYQDAETYKKKYGKKLRRIPEMIGYINIGGDNIFQFESMAELQETLTEFNKLNNTVYLYTSKDDPTLYTPYPEVPQSGITEDSLLPKIFKSTGVIYDKDRLRYTTIIGDGKLSCLQGYYPPSDTDIVNHLYTDTLFSINNVGKISNDVKAADLPHRKKPGGGNITDLLYIGDYTNKYPKYAISINSSSPNLLHIERIEKDTKKIVVTTAGITYILGVYDASYKECLVKLPANCVQNMRIRHIYITDLDLTKDKSYITININSDKNIKRNKEAMLATLAMSSLS